MAVTDAPPGLRTPAQQAVVDQLGASRGHRPAFPADLAARLRAELDGELSPVVAHLDPDDPMVVSKRALAGAHGCQAQYVGEPPFDWSAASVRGVVAHKAIELSVHLRGEPTPLDLVDEAMARLGEGEGTLADWLRTCGDVERAEVRGEANDRVATFLECWPPLRREWVPVTESRVRVDDLCGGRLRLVGKVDLTLGRAAGTTAGKVLVDLKTGGFTPDHLHDLRFYALLETLKLGVPPRRLATYYLEAGRIVPEDVTEGLLAAAVARTVAGVTALVALKGGEAEPVRRPGPACWWCRVRSGCEPGRAWVEAAADGGP